MIRQRTAAEKRARRIKARAKSKRIGTVRQKPAVKKYPDGREVCNLQLKAGREEYHRRTMEMRSRQNNLCGICDEYMYRWNTTFEHQDGRGMNGGHRDDRIVKDGKPYNMAAHSWCNVEKGSKRGD